MSIQTRAAGSIWGVRWQVLQRIARQEVRDALLGWSFYLTAAVALLLAALLVYNSVRFVDESGLNIVSRPFFQPLFVATSLALLYVIVGAALAIVRPREQGALQILFFAPVDAAALVGAHFLAGVAIYALLLALLVPPLLLLVWITNFVVPASLLWGLLPTLPVAGLGVAFGLFVSAIARSSRMVVLLLVAVLLLLWAIQGGYAALLNIPPTSRYYDALRFLRVVSRNLNAYLVWVSPFHALDASLEAALRGGWGAVASYGLAALAESLLWLAAAIAGVRERGVLP
ncbi:MAG: ABC transporter permease subunit [Chloroflexota bacterium]|nr:ABC transporter permease subunit [Chloroflexota bacterium]